MATHDAPPGAPLTRDQLTSPFESWCSPHRLIGAEGERFGVRLSDGVPLRYDDEPSVRTILAAFHERHGWKPKRETDDGPVIALTKDAASITLEPGSQLELSGAPLPSVTAIAEESDAFFEQLDGISRPLGIGWIAMGFHPFAEQSELDWVPKSRYRVMREYLPTRGANALEMMRRTSTVQANFDYANEQEALAMVRLGLRLSPFLTALVANSPLVSGAPYGGMSHRAAVWLDVDPDRQGLLPELWHDDAGFKDYATWALRAPMFLFVRDGRPIHNTGQPFEAFLEQGFEGHRPTMEDWVLHLNTMFPEVRLKRTIEVRGADSVPRPYAHGIIAAWTGLLYDDEARGEALAWTRDFGFEEVRALRPDVARHGVRAAFRGRPLVAWLGEVLDLAEAGLARRHRAGGADDAPFLTPLRQLLEDGRCPADRVLEALADKREASSKLAPGPERAALAEQLVRVSGI